MAFRSFSLYALHHFYSTKWYSFKQPESELAYRLEDLRLLCNFYH